MNTELLLSTEERARILSHVIYMEREFGVNEIARALGLSKGLVSKYLDALVKETLLKRSKKKFLLNENHLLRGIRIMFNLQRIGPKIFRKYRFVKASGLYGSCAKGTNTQSSDVDVWIRVEKTGDENIAELTSELRKSIANIKILILDDKKLELLKKKDPLFYYALHFGSIILQGEENGI